MVENIIADREKTPQNPKPAETATGKESLQVQPLTWEAFHAGMESLAAGQIQPAEFAYCMKAVKKTPDKWRVILDAARSGRWDWRLCVIA